MREPPSIDFWQVPRCWPGECVAILAGGPNLTQEQVDYVRGKCRVIAINRAGILPPCAPWADWLWGCDARPHGFWSWYPRALKFPGVKVAVRGISPGREVWAKLKQLNDAGVKVIKHSGHKHLEAVPRHEGLSADPGVVHGNNSLAQVLSVIHHTGAETVLLLGVDMRRGRAHGRYPQGGEPSYASAIIPPFATFVGPLRKAGVAVLNCSPNSALPYWPHVELESVI